MAASCRRFSRLAVLLSRRKPVRWHENLTGGRVHSCIGNGKMLARTLAEFIMKHIYRDSSRGGHSSTRRNSRGYNLSMLKTVGDRVPHCQTAGDPMTVTKSSWLCRIQIYTVLKPHLHPVTILSMVLIGVTTLCSSLKWNWLASVEISTFHRAVPAHWPSSCRSDLQFFQQGACVECLGIRLVQCHI